MVKKLQALKAKKGFTLVELIVVIAIIGVLAAILIPTMMGMVTKARVTSADETAKHLSDTVTTWMSDLEANKGIIPSGNIAIVIAGSSTASGDTNIWTTGGVKFQAKNDSGTLADLANDKGFQAANDSDGSKAKKKLADTLANDYNFNTDITAIVWVSNRKVVGCAYSDTGNADLSGFTVDAFRSAYYNWGGKTDGVDETKNSGKIIGTSPKLLLDNEPTSSASSPAST